MLRNDGGNRAHRLSLRLVGHRSNRDGIGAGVRVVTPKGMVLESGGAGTYSPARNCERSWLMPRSRGTHGRLLTTVGRRSVRERRSGALHAARQLRPRQLSRFWPKAIEPEGVPFVGAYADNLNSGLEAATRSANRVAAATDNA